VALPTVPTVVSLGVKQLWHVFHLFLSRTSVRMSGVMPSWHEWGALYITMNPVFPHEVTYYCIHSRIKAH